MYLFRAIAGSSFALVVSCGVSRVDRGGQPADVAVASSTPIVVAPVVAPATTPAASSTVPPRATLSRCGSRLVNVTLRQSAFAARSPLTESDVRRVAESVLMPIRANVLDLVVSPAIRAVRIRISDTASVDRVMRSIRASPSVEDVSPDDCSLRIQRADLHAVPTR